ncbi:MAG: hypothetical protein ACHQCI_05490 [Solirubrobacterales bacterium]
MGRTSRIGSFAAAVALIGALLLPVSGAAGSPTAHKSGAIINYVTTGKLRIAKRIIVPIVCSVNCDVVSSLKLKGPFVKGTDVEQGSLQAGVPAGHFIKPSGPLLKLLKASPGRYKVISNVTATDPATGATDQIAHSFKLKR